MPSLISIHLPEAPPGSWRYRFDPAWYWTDQVVDLPPTTSSGHLKRAIGWSRRHNQRRAINGVHDLDGIHGFGPIVRDPNEPLFRTAWEEHVHTIGELLMDDRYVTVDAFRKSFPAPTLLGLAKIRSRSIRSDSMPTS